MSNDTKEQLKDLIGNNQSADVDWKARCEELEKQLNSTRVEEGRVKKLSEELKARDEELAKLRAIKEEENLLDSLSPEERDEVPPEFLNATTKLIRGGMERVRSQYDQRIKDYESQMATSRQEAAERELLSKIDSTFPRFRQDIAPGGDKHEAWNVYRQYNNATIADALARSDFNTLSYHIKKFYTDHLGVSDPTEGLGAAASDPSNVSAASSGQYGEGNKLTAEELDALYERVEKARDDNDYAEVRRLTKIINQASTGS